MTRERELWKEFWDTVPQDEGKRYVDWLAERIAELGEENKKLKRDNEWMRKRLDLHHH